MTAAATTTIAAIVSARRPRSPEARARLSARSNNRLRPQPVADRANRLNRRRAAGERQLAPQVADVDAEDVRARIVLVAPHRRQDPRPRDGLAGVAGEEGEQLELRSRQADLGTGTANPPAQKIDLDVAGL